MIVQFYNYPSFLRHRFLWFSFFFFFVLALFFSATTSLYAQGVAEPSRENEERPDKRNAPAATAPGTFFTYPKEDGTGKYIISTDALREELFLKRSQESGRLSQEAMKLMRQRKIEEARKVLWNALAFAPNNSLAYSLLAQIYFWKGEEDQAFQVLEQAGRYLVKGDVVYGFLDRALIFFQKQQKADPPYPLVSVATFKDNKRCALSFNFDDGSKSVYSVVLPIFDRFGYKTTIFINPGWTTDTPSNPYYGSWEEWRDAYSRGHEIGNHSMNHRYLTDLPEDIFAAEISESYNAIVKKIGKAPLSFAFPFDQSTPGMVGKVAETHHAIRERQYLKKIHENVFLPVYGGDKFSSSVGQKLIDLAILKRLWVVSECHAVKTEEVMTFKPITIEFLEDHLSYIKEREDRIWVDTFAQTYLYLTERQASRIKILEHRPGRVLFVLDHGLDKSLYNVPLTVIVDASPDYPDAVTVRQGRTLLPADIKGNLVLINIVPAPVPVLVRWK